MELPRGQQSGKDFWIAHIRAAETFAGTNKEYCKIHGLNLGSFSGYKNKFGYSRRTSKPASGFSEIRVTPAEPLKSERRLPDPNWLAEFLRAWVAQR